MIKEGLLAFWLHMSTARYREIITAFGSVDTFWSASKSDLQILKWREIAIDKFITWRNFIDAEKCERDLKRTQARIITINNPEYPTLLASIFDPPYALFVRGKLKTEKPLLAVVGTRKNTFVGAQAITTIVEAIANTIGIVSGLAFGIDSLAHKAALRAKGYTIAVLGAGFDSDELTFERKKISEEIVASGGAVITEYPPGTTSTRFTFPERNRIISGLCQATLVIEAGVKSGALITASSALEQGREVLAIPHSIFSSVGIGPNNLIREGATMITNSNDLRKIFDLIPKNKIQSTLAISSNPIENMVFTFLGSESQTSDAIGRELKISTPQVAVLLTEMEIKGMIQALPGSRYCVAHA